MKSYEDSCRKSLGLPAGGDTDMEEEPTEEEAVPEEGEAPAEDDTSPPE